MDLISEKQFLMVRTVIDAVLRHRHLSGNCLFKLQAGPIDLNITSILLSTKAADLARNSSQTTGDKWMSIKEKAGLSISVGEIQGPIISCAEGAELRDERSLSRRKEDHCCSLLITSISISPPRTDFLSGSVSKAGDQTMGHGTGATMKVLCFNPGSRLKEKSQDAALNH
ncbi:hypothetical protein PAMP_014430 [Pampus punctatissimus]